MTASSPQELADALADLREGANRLARLPLADRIQLTKACLAPVHQSAKEWVERCCQAKAIPDDSGARAEEVTAGPVATLRFLRLLLATLLDVQATGRPKLPGAVRTVDGQVRVVVMPTRELFDAVMFAPLSAETWLQPGVTEDRMFGDALDHLRSANLGPPRVAVVLGAGNVSAIAITDTLSKVLQEGQAVLLKMNPVNDYLEDVFAAALQPLVAAGYLRIVCGGADVGAAAIAHDAADTVHITGSIDTHNQIVWGSRKAAPASDPPLLHKPITSELGNVTPWLIAPDQFTEKQVAFQAQQIAASIVNNASFNCVATKMLVTWRQWPDRERWMQQVELALSKVAPRVAYYPGAHDRFQEFSGRDVPSTVRKLPWTLLRDVDPQTSPHLFQQESFVCVCGETALDADSPEQFLDRAVEFVNDRMWGTLAAALTVTRRFRKQHQVVVDRAIKNLRYGTIGINQWPALGFALMSPPWGGYPHGVTLADAQSGIGTVHNTFLLDRPQKTVVESDVTIFPKPIWFASHRRSEAVAWKLCDLYASPSAARLPSLFWDALRG